MAKGKEWGGVGGGKNFYLEDFGGGGGDLKFGGNFPPKPGMKYTSPKMKPSMCKNKHTGVRPYVLVATVRDDHYQITQQEGQGY